MAKTPETSLQGIVAKNLILNSNFSFAERGNLSSYASTGAAIYTLDRWYQFSVTGTTTYKTASTITGSHNALKMQRNSGQSAATQYICQPFETTNIAPVRGKYLTLSFYAKAGANFSSAGSIINITLVTGTGAEGKAVGGSFTGSVGLISLSQAITTTMTKYTFTSTVVVPTNATQMELYFSFTSVGTSGADDSITLEQVMLNEGLGAASYSMQGSSIADEFNLCQRYFERQIHPNGSYNLGVAHCYSGTDALSGLKYLVHKRTTPAASVSGTPRVLNANAGTATGNVAVTQMYPDSLMLVWTSGGYTRAGDAGAIQCTGSDVTFSIEAEI